MTEDRVLVKLDDSITKIGSIIVPEAKERNKALKGTIISIGKGYKDNPILAKVGDHIAFSKYVGKLIEVEGEMYKMIRYPEIDAFI